MTALEYMQKQVKKHWMHLEHEKRRGAPEVILQNITAKIGHYEEAIEALKERGNNADRDD